MEQNLAKFNIDKIYLNNNKISNNPHNNNKDSLHLNNRHKLIKKWTEINNT